MGQMAAGTAHHLNTPLAALLLRVQMMRERIFEEPTATDLDRLESGLLFCQQFVRRLLELPGAPPRRSSPSRWVRPWNPSSPSWRRRSQASAPRFSLDLAGVDGGRRCVRTTKGIHLLLPHITDHAVYIAAKRDDRMFFVIPWQQFTLVGTTDTDFSGDLDRLAATHEEVQYLMRETQGVFPPAKMREEDISYTYSRAEEVLEVLARGRRLEERALLKAPRAAG